MANCITRNKLHLDEWKLLSSKKDKNNRKYVLIIVKRIRGFTWATWRLLTNCFYIIRRFIFIIGKNRTVRIRKYFQSNRIIRQSPQISLMYIYSLIFSLGSLVSCLLANPWNTNFQRHEENNPCLAGLKLNKVHRLPL